MKVNLRRAAVIAALIGVGVLVGFVLRPADKELVAATEMPANAVQSTGVDEVTQPVANDRSDEIITSPPQTEEEVPEQSKEVVPPIKLRIPQDEVARAEQENSRPARRFRDQGALSNTVANDFYQGDKDAPLLQSAQPSITDAATGERMKKQRGTAGEEKKSTAVPTSDFGANVSVQTNEYKRVAFGGIRNLRLTVTNHTGHELDQVIVELTYLKPSEEPLMRENIVFKSIPANQAATVRVPDTNRGIKVTYRVTSVRKQGAETAGM